jgi:CRISPR-associated exonuclease Cas4
VETLLLSLLNDFLYCSRRAALKAIEGWREENVHTILGELAHEHADLSGYEVAKGVLVWRSLPIWSERLGLLGKCDIVEVEPASTSNLKSEISDLKSGDFVALRPVEYKKGKCRKFENDDAQVCAQALCLEEMFGITIARGAIFHAASKRRREVEFTTGLRALTENAITELHRLLRSEQVPPAVFKSACKECSLFEVCLPKVTGDPKAAHRAAATLFQV